MSQLLQDCSDRDLVHELRRRHGDRITNEVVSLRACGIQFHHFYNTQRQLVATFCSQLVGPATVRFAGVLHNRGKARNRDIAYGRLIKGNSALLPLDEFQRQLEDRTLVIWLGKPHAATGERFGLKLYRQGILPAQPRRPKEVSDVSRESEQGQGHGKPSQGQQP